MKKAFLLYILLYSSLNAQVKIPRDTSFTINSAYLKEKKNYPFITIANPETPKGIIIKKNIVFEKIGERTLLLDIYYPAKKTKKGYPGVLMIFGGGWKSGDKSHNSIIAKELASKGYVAVSAEYRLSPEAKYPAAVHDLKSAIRWMRSNAAKYSIDPSQIASLGFSAGGQLASLIGATNDYHRLDGSGSNQNQSNTVQAVINIDGILAFHHPESAEGKVAAEWLNGTYQENPDNWTEASALSHVKGNAVPTLFINSSIPRFHAGRDDLIKKMDSLGVYSEVHTLENTPHPFLFFDPWFEPTVNYIVRFLDRVFKE